MTKSKTTALLLLVASFVLGALAGGAVSALASGPNKWRSKEAMIERMSADLNLSDAQRDTIGAIIDRHHQRFRAIREEVRQDIRDALTDEQRNRFDALTDSLKKAHDRDHDKDSTTPR